MFYYSKYNYIYYFYIKIYEFTIQGQFHKHELPNLTKKLTAEPKPYYFNYALDDMVVLQQTILSLQEKAKILDINIKILEGMFDGLRIGTKQNGGYVNARQVKKLFNEALKVYDADKMGMQGEKSLCDLFW